MSSGLEAAVDSFNYTINLRWDEALKRFEVSVPEIGTGIKGYGVTVEEAITAAHRAVAHAVASIMDAPDDSEQGQEKTVA
jgi:hypothetical protein